MGKGCTRVGVCGKDAQTADLQDLLVYAAKGIAFYGHRLRSMNYVDKEADRFILEALFSTVTNVNFDPVRLEALIAKAGQIKNRLQSEYIKACRKAGKSADKPTDAAQWTTPKNRDEMPTQAQTLSIAKKIEVLGADIAGLQSLILFGLKGTAAYADHAMILGEEDDSVYTFFHEALDFLTGPKATNVDELVAMAMKVGEVNLKVMELLDIANTGTYGHPEPTQVRVTPVRGKAILVSGHDLKDLELLLKQTEGRGVNVYTHGEMLPCNAYPGLKKYKHLVGNYGSAWQNQHKEFEVFGGAILMTTNCLQRPKDSYIRRIFTTGLVAWPEVKHIADKNFEPVIQAALAEKGFKKDEPEQKITIGFGHNTVMSVAGAVIDAVKAGKIKHFFLIGGCDGAKPGRNYYTDFAQAAPNNCVILTLACGKYRFNKLSFGDIDGIPRLLDIGQCNDAYSAIQIAVALAKAFNCGVNDLPLSMILSWYEQKAVCILLTLLHLGIRNIKLGPSLPAFIGPNVLKLLVDKFNIAPTTTVEQDLKAILKT
jgi:hydroxylamine reductase